MRTPQRTTWPKVRRTAVDGRPRVAVVVANYNTRRLIAQLIFSLYRILGRDQFDELVVVDNASTDGSRQLLVALERAGLIHLLANAKQRYHGPAVTQGISWLARGQQSGLGAAVEYIWVLDSDVIVRRRETLRDALAVLERERAAVVGQAVADPTYDVLLKHNREMLQPFSLLLDPQLVWRRPIPPFVEDGAPATALQIAADARGLRLVSFPFIEGRYLLHLGRGTLRAIAAAGDSANRYYTWALDHRDYHFAGQDTGAIWYRVFCDLFDAEVGALSAENLVASVGETTDLLRPPDVGT
jgi:glycosyltransferase involved in cell wall biosynthesis